MLELIKTALEDIATCFGIEEDLFTKYVADGVTQETDLRAIITRRDQMADWQEHTPLGGPGTVLNGCILYSLVNHYNISSALETGVSGGFYTAFLLNSLKKTKGKLTSLELADSDEVGKLITKPWPKHWDLQKGQDSLQYLQNNNVQADLYCHDSLHTLGHMLKELIFFKRCNKDRFFIYIDDQNADNFWNFAKNTNAFYKVGYDLKYISGAESRLKGHVGGFLKYERK